MTDPDAALRAREWLECQLAELGQLRNASRRDHNFKTWRQQTLTVIQRVWPGETRRVDRFRRIPFSSPAPRATDAQVRECYERGWGEAGVLLREFLAEIDLLGLPQVQADGTRAGSETEAAMGPMPTLGGPDAAPPAVLGPKDGGAGDDIGRAMDRLLGRSQTAGGSAPALRLVPTGPVPEPGSPAAELVRLAGELEALGLPPRRAGAARAALLALARAARAGTPPWDRVEAVLEHAGATPELARRVLPLLHGFIAKAA